MVERFQRSDLKHAFLRAARFRRIHIVGCSRSGTSMLHYAHAAFRNTVLFDDEVSAWNYPSLRDSVTLFLRHAARSGRGYLITKRGELWYRPAAVERLAHYARRHQIFVLLIVRNPLDVITSHLKLHRRQFFVQPEVWERSADAGEQLFALLDDHPHKLQLRYEDIVQQPDHAQAGLMAATGLELAPGIDSWATLQSNVERRRSELTTMIPFMHRLRDFDAASIGRWRSDPDQAAFIREVLRELPQGPRILRFMTDHGYKPPADASP